MGELLSRKKAENLVLVLRTRKNGEGERRALFSSQGKEHDDDEEYFYTLLDGVVVHHMVIPINYFHYGERHG